VIAFIVFPLPIVLRFDRLDKSGFSPELTYRGYHAIDSHILGFTMWHLGHSAGGEDVTGGQDPEDFVAELVPRLRTSRYRRIAQGVDPSGTSPGPSTSNHSRAPLTSTCIA
jgi:hypothetical protein